MGGLAVTMLSWALVGPRLADRYHFARARGRYPIRKPRGERRIIALVAAGEGLTAVISEIILPSGCANGLRFLGQGDLVIRPRQPHRGRW